MRIIYLILLAFLVCSCAKSPGISDSSTITSPIHICGAAQPEYSGPVPFTPMFALSIENDIVHYVNPVGPIKNRIFMFNGVGTYPEAYLFAPYENLAKDLLNKGYQIVLVMIDSSIDPECFIQSFQDDGTSYALYWKTRMAKIVDAFDIQFGAVSNTLVAGFSLGGIHALMAVELLPNRFNGYFVHEPVIHLNAVLEFSSFNTPKFDPYFDLTSLSKVPGFIDWGTNDYRVNWNLDKTLYQDLTSLGANITGVEWADLGHETHQEQVDAIQTWLDTNF